MLLTEKEKEEIMELAKRRKRSENEEWLARHFSNVPQGWKK
jgi:hypothetical protein